MDKDSNKLEEVVVISMEGLLNIHAAREVDMQFPDLEMFTRGAHDPEGARYRIMAALDAAAKEFHRSRLYPGLGDLIELVSVLETVRDNKDQYAEVMPRKLSGVDFENKALQFDTEPADPSMIEQMFELIDWALPEVKKITDEGVAMFDFVNTNLNIDVVGIMPMYRDEGYAFVTDRKDNVLHVLRYELSIFSDKDDNYRALKTVEIDSREIDAVIVAPEDVKLQLIDLHKDLPNPATYLVDTDLDFPFDATILPVAKRKLMKHLIS